LLKVGYPASMIFYSMVAAVAATMGEVTTVTLGE
jgi:hypothetical protein